jgi:hypothetical protein
MQKEFAKITFFPHGEEIFKDAKNIHTIFLQYLRIFTKIS